MTQSDGAQPPDVSRQSSAWSATTPTIVRAAEAQILPMFRTPLGKSWIVRAPAFSEDWTLHLRTLSHPSWVTAVAFSADGRLIVSGSADNTVRIWDAATGAQRHLLPIDTLLRFLSFSSCGKHLVTDRGTLRLPYSDCRCSHHIFATKSWITDDGNELLYLYPDYQDSFGFVSGSVVILTGQGLSALQLDLSEKRHMTSSICRSSWSRLG